jgi:superfamily I DNA/RNA helicase
LRAFGSEIGLPREFTILDRSDQVEEIQRILKHLNIDDQKFDPDAILFQIGQAKNRLLSGDAAQAFFLESSRLPTELALATAHVFQAYTDRLRLIRAVDFDDLMVRPIEILERVDSVRTRLNEKFRYLLVDEYQDTNPAQFRLLKLLTERSQNLCVVGDDDQSIYAWRGASSEHILSFRNHYPQAEIITLAQNYRSTKTILDAANFVIRQNQKRHPKELWSDKGEGEPIREMVVAEDRAEAELIGDEILLQVTRPGSGRNYGDFAVLYRSNPQSRLFEEALRRKKIPYRIVGTLSFLDRKEVKDTLSYLRLLSNPHDNPSFYRTINWPPRGLGKSTLETIHSYAHTHQLSEMDALRALLVSETLATRARESAKGFLSTYDRLRAELLLLEPSPQLPEQLAAWVRRVLEAFKFQVAIAAETDTAESAARKYENALEIANSLGQMQVAPGVSTGASLLSEYLANLTVDPEEDEEEDPSRSLVTLLTFHGSKGLEWPVVFLVGFEEGLIPHRKVIEEGGSVEEERRLAYVGITRAKQSLYITRARERIRYGKRVPRLPSRFLDEIPENLRTREILTEEGSAPVTDPDQHEALVKDFLSQVRKSLTP